MKNGVIPGLIFCMSFSAAHAEVVITFSQPTPNVVRAEYSGTINLGTLTNPSVSAGVGTLYFDDPFGIVELGASGRTDEYSPTITGVNAPFLNFFVYSTADSGVGGAFGLAFGPIGDLGTVDVPDGYVSNTTISGSSDFTGTLASLKLKAGNGFSVSFDNGTGTEEIIFNVPGNTIGVTVTGFRPGGAVILQNNGTDNYVQVGDGTFVFPTALVYGQSYSVSVLTQPTGQTCSVTDPVGSGNGTMAGVDITGIQVQCIDNLYTIGGQLTGLPAGDSVVLQNNGGDDRLLTANGTFSFLTPLEYEDPYNVTVLTQPTTPGANCIVDSGAGTVPNDNVKHVRVTCTTTTFSVGGTVSGLAATEAISLENNGADTITSPPGSSGPFAFPTELADGSNYAVSVSRQPDSQTCSVANSTGIIAGADVTNIAINCVDNEYSVGGLLSGLVPGDSVVLQNNAGDNLTLTADGPFTFPSTLNFNDPYAVTVLTNPPAPSETCTVSNGSGTMPTANVNNVSVTCKVDTFPIEGSITGLASSNSVTLQLNGAKDQNFTGNGPFAFTPIADGSNYVVSVSTQPMGQNCAVVNGSGVLSGAPVTNVAVTCVDNQYTIGGLLSGLVPGDSVVLQNNGADDLTLTADGAFTFTAPVDFGDPYAVSVLTNPPAPSETCTVTNGSGTMPANDINSVSVTCAVDTFTVGGNLTGLFSGGSVVLQINGSHDQVLTADGNFIFPALVDGTTYTVTVATQPIDQFCTVSDGSGQLAGANISDVEVTCTLFYEGIPALDRYGLVLLALLMLGVGFIGMRRIA